MDLNSEVRATLGFEAKLIDLAAGLGSSALHKRSTGARTARDARARWKLPEQSLAVRGGSYVHSRDSTLG